MGQDVTITVNDEQLFALTATLDVENARIDAMNRRIQADKDLIASGGGTYTGPEPQSLLTLRDLVQQRFNERVAQDVQMRSRSVADDIAAIYMKADPATRDAIMKDIDKYRTQKATHNRLEATKKRGRQHESADD